ncbi:MAG: HPr(Ser) kinase/phosphatase [Bacteroidota bacterium]
MRTPQPFKKESITVAYMVAEMRQTVHVDIETVHEGEAEERLVTESNLHRPGIALAGYTDLFTHQRVQVLGNTENQFLAHLGEDDRAAAFQRLVNFPVPCLILTESNQLPIAQVEQAKRAGVPVYRTPMPSTEFMYHLRDFLEDQFAPMQTVHASMVDVYGVGLLLTGKSGIGKSEVALDLVERGHRLVADDVVVVTKKAENVVMGAGTDLMGHFMEIRGIGLVDVRSMFGIRAIRFQKRIEVVVEMEHWERDREYTRVGMTGESQGLLGVDLPLVRLPIIPGKNVTVICEVIAMNHLLRHYGYDPAEIMKQRLAERIAAKNDGGARPRRGVTYFEHDYE